MRISSALLACLFLALLAAATTVEASRMKDGCLQDGVTILAIVLWLAFVRVVFLL
jgi:hypothetical protein